MKDEYANMDSAGETYTTRNFELESGEVLPEAVVRYKTFGQLNSSKNNLLVVCHALTGNSSLEQWWGSMLGPGKSFDTDKYLVVCANVLGSCYGSTGPRSIDPRTGRPYGMSFPDVTIRDSVRLHMQMCKEGIGAANAAAVVGGSLGGMQALEWAIMGGSFVRKTVAIGCGAAHTAWQIGISEAQRQAIYMDAKWNGGNVDMADPPKKGLSVARQMAMLSYRTAKGYQAKFGRERCKETGKWQTRKYLEHQGTKFLDRFDAVTYIKLTEQMDRHDIGRGRGGVKQALDSIAGEVMIMGIDSDLLYPIHEQQELAALMPRAAFRVIKSDDGHDGFLLEQDQVANNIASFL